MRRACRRVATKPRDARAPRVSLSPPYTLISWADLFTDFGRYYQVEHIITTPATWKLMDESRSGCWRTKRFLGFIVAYEVAETTLAAWVEMLDDAATAESQAEGGGL